MNEAFRRVLADYEARASREQDAPPGESYDQLLLPIGASAGLLLNAMIKGLGARTIIELGTSFGYSTLWLAEAARATGGEVTTYDVAAHKQDYAAAMLERAELRGYVDFQLGDALELLERFDTAIDFVLLDVWKELYLPLLDLLYPKLGSTAVVVADNMLYPPSAHQHAAEYRAAVRAKAGMESVLLTVGNGLEVSRFYGPG